MPASASPKSMLGRKLLLHEALVASGLYEEHARHEESMVVKTKVNNLTLHVAEEHAIDLKLLLP